MNVPWDQRDIDLHGGQEVVAGEPITFSYSFWVKHSDKEWATRMDHYMNYGSSTIDWESFAIAIAVCVVASLCIGCMFASILKKDIRILN